MAFWLCRETAMVCSAWEIGMLCSASEPAMLCSAGETHTMLCREFYHALLLKRSLCYVMLCRGSFCHAFVYSAGEPLPCHALLCRRALVMPFSTLQLGLCDAMLCSVGDPLLCHALFCWGVSYILCSGGGTASVWEGGGMIMFMEPSIRIANCNLIAIEATFAILLSAPVGGSVWVLSLWEFVLKHFFFFFGNMLPRQMFSSLENYSWVLNYYY